MSDRHRQARTAGTSIALVERTQSPAQIANLKPFAVGRSGNPLGRRKGSRNKISQAFVDEMCASFEQHGRDTIERVREQHPVEYLKIAAALIPKSFDPKPVDRLDELTDTQLDLLLMITQAQIEAQERGDKTVTLTLSVSAHGP